MPGTRQSARCPLVVQYGLAAFALKLCLEVASDESRRMDTLGFYIPGLMELTRIFFGPNSLARTCVTASTAPLVAVYTAVVGGITWLVVEPMLMILPPSAPKNSAASWVARMSPNTLVLNCRWNCSSVISPSGANWWTPALFTSTSNLPKAFLVSAKMRWTSEDLAASPCTATALPPFRDLRYYAAGALIARGIVHNNGGALRCQGLCDAGANSFGCTGYNCTLFFSLLMSLLRLELSSFIRFDNRLIDVRASSKGSAVISAVPGDRPLFRGFGASARD